VRAYVLFGAKKHSNAAQIFEYRLTGAVLPPVQSALKNKVLSRILYTPIAQLFR
jgi:hypothetical protein